MAEVRLTPEQQKVVDTRDCNLLVAAAAGSGKTAVLVKRIIKKVTDTERPQDIDRLLIVTFTNAAAAEMRERIGAAIEAALAADPENRHLQRQMLLLHNAQITTIHSFCLSVIREFFPLISLDPGFRIGNEAELALMRSDVTEEVLEAYYEREDEAFTSFVDCFGSVRSDAQVTEYIDKLYETAMSHPWPKAWLESLLAGFSGGEDEFRNHPMLSRVLSEGRKCLEDCLRVADRMVALSEETDGPALYRDCFIEDKRELERVLFELGDYTRAYDALQSLSFGRLPSKKQEVSEEKKQLAKNLRDYIKKQVGKLKEDYFYATLPELFEEQSEMEKPMRGLILVTEEFMHRYQQKKRDNNLLDFNDLEHYALQILVEQQEDGIRPTAAARTLAARYDEIMIDEYQDSNLIQESILGSISGEWDGTPNVFMVGDVKQSIYRFRMACPDLFMEKYRTYQEDGLYRKIDLHKNFRSREGILNAINVVFAGLMHEDSTEVEYDAAAALYFGATYPAEQEAHRTEVLFVSMEESDGDMGEKMSGTPFGSDAVDEASMDGESESTVAETGELSQEEASQVTAEALAVAARIKELLRDGFVVGNEQRPADYGDMVILLRTMSGWSEKFLEVLTEQGIPAYADTSSGYFKTFEVRKTLDFLRILDNPRQDIPFAAVLHSPIAGFDAQELANLRVRYGMVSKEEKKQCSLYDAARAAAENEPEGLAAKFFALYDRLREEADYISIHELLGRFYRYSGFYDVVTVMPGGERRRGNLDMLLVHAKQYEATSFSGLYDFIRYIDRLIKYEVDFGEAANGEGGKLVRIMSIHKSKGLEFPIVFLCGMEKKLNRMDMRKRLIFHSELGLGPEYVDAKLRIKAPTLLKKMIAGKMNEEMIAEELRVLYVAMTRAKEKLIMVGALKKPEKRYATWRERAETVNGRGLLSTHVMKAETYFDFLCPLLFAAGETGLDVRAGACVKVTRVLSGTTFIGEFALKEVGLLEQETEKLSVQLTKAELWEVLKRLAEAEGVVEENTPMSAVRELLTRRAEFVYPYKEAAELPVKVTVSELKRRYLEEEEAQTLLPDEDEYTYPEFLQPEKILSGSDRGTIYHHVMELFPFEEGMTRNKVKTILDSMVKEGRLRPEEREVVSDFKLSKFFSSRLGKKMCHAQTQGLLHREQPFVLGLPAKELYPDTDSEEIVLVQGIIDAFFEEEDGLVLMDYKTDYIHEDAKAELTKKYQAQLEYYRIALERLTGKPVKEIWFYAFAKDEDFRID